MEVIPQLELLIWIAILLKMYWIRCQIKMLQPGIMWTNAAAIWGVLYMRQSGGEVTVFYGARMQRGHGLGSIRGGWFRRALPFISSVAKILHQQAIKDISVMTDGKSFQDSAKCRQKEGIKPSSRRIRTFLSLAVLWERRGRLDIFFHNYGILTRKKLLIRNGRVRCIFSIIYSD